MSVIEIAICRYEDTNYIDDFKTMKIISGSDHDAMQVKLNVLEKNVKMEAEIHWYQRRAGKYKEDLKKEVEKINTKTSTTNKNRILCNVLKKVAKNVGM